MYSRSIQLSENEGETGVSRENFLVPLLSEEMQRLVEQNAQDKELLVRLATLQEKLKDTQTAQATLASARSSSTSAMR